MGHSEKFLEQVKGIADRLETPALERIVAGLGALREKGGRLFLLGVGGSAANASHAVNDFRKIAGIEAYCCTDNVSELSARINDEGWESSFAEWLRASRLSSKDAVFVLSVGGGNPERGVSLNIVAALRYAKEAGAKILGIVGRDGGYTSKVADHFILVPTADESLLTFHVESFQSVLLHLIVSHPSLKRAPAKWEALTR
ncbi:MAG: SIS domain-containing protein [Deltaproteobacteria bacterium]|nr:SIS domain-containing protein [Deltaproteobacteria bacterium]